MTAIYLNGSESSDDLAVVKYVWTREDTSLAAGTIVGDTDKEAVMIVSALLIYIKYIYRYLIDFLSPGSSPMS